MIHDSTCILQRFLLSWLDLESQRVCPKMASSRVYWPVFWATWPSRNTHTYIYICTLRLRKDSSGLLIFLPCLPRIHPACSSSESTVSLRSAVVQPVPVDSTEGPYLQERGAAYIGSFNKGRQWAMNVTYGLRQRVDLSGKPSEFSLVSTRSGLWV